MSNQLDGLPQGVQGAAALLAGYYDTVSLGGGLTATPARLVFNDDERRGGWLDEPPTWWRIADGDRELVYYPLGRREFQTPRALVAEVHRGLKNDETTDVLHDDGIPGFLEQIEERREERANDDNGRGVFQ